MKKKILPVLLGADIGTYSIARSFHENYNVKSLAISTSKKWITAYSKIINTIIINDIDETKLINKLKEIAKSYPDSIKILMGCSEWYNDIIIKNKNKLNKQYIIPFVHEKILNEIVKKAKFYSICEKLNINYPDTIVVNKQNYKKIDIPFDYPIVMKASWTTKYHDAHFEGKKKVFIFNNKKEFDTITNNIYNSTYDDDLIVQKFIKGNDSNMRVLTCFCDNKSNVLFSSLGQPLLEENSPGAIGNYTAIINREDNELLDQAKKILKYVKYKGFANFDIKYDEITKKFYFFEINVRLGRSNYYITGSGFNYTKILIDEYVFHKKNKKEIITNKKVLYSVIPFSIIKKYVQNKELVQEAKELIKNNKVVNPSNYSKDRSLKRLFYILASKLNYIRKYKKYYNK